MKKKRLDILLVEKGLVENRSIAQRYIMAGQVTVNAQVAGKPSQLFLENDDIKIKDASLFVSRGGIKLQHALTEFGFHQLDNKVCVDVGASTGGFTDCLLKFGVKRVYAIDVGYGQLHYKLRNDPRVVVMERTNVKNIIGLPEKIDLVTVDASFISLKHILPVIRTWPRGNELIVIALIKPQFEVGKEIASKGRGVVRDEKLHLEVIENIISFSKLEGFENKGITESPILGPKGNKEFLIYLLIRD